MLLETIAALLFAIALGTPGCEIGVWPELIAGARGSGFEPARWLTCLVGLRYLDQWEACWHPRPAAGTKPGQALDDEGRTAAASLPKRTRHEHERE